MVRAQVTMEGTDTELSKICDRLLECREATAAARENEHAAEAELIQEMSKGGKKSIKHDGRTIRLVHQEEKNKIQIKSE